MQIRETWLNIWLSFITRVTDNSNTGTFLSLGSKDSYASLKLLPTLAIPGRLICDAVFSGLAALERGGEGAVKSL